jgi:hypothetical protein
VEHKQLYDCQSLDLEATYRWLVGHSGSFLVYVFKTRAGILPSFQPYQTLQLTLNRWVGTDVPAFVPWALSFVNGMAILGFLFARIYQLLPGRNGTTKGLTFGLMGWIFMGLIFFPVIGLGPFAFGAGLGIAPALLSLAMLLTYSLVLGTVYGALDAWPPSAKRNLTGPLLARHGRLHREMSANDPKRTFALPYCCLPV